MRVVGRVACCVVAAVALASCASSAHPGAAPDAERTRVPAVTSATPRPETSRTSSAAPSRSAVTAHRRTTATGHPTATPVTALPLRYGTGTATQVITVVAASTTSTTAAVQAWRKQGSGWVRVGPQVTGFVGSDGLSTHPSETRSATPIGSFTLTRAFGALGDPGTALPYRHTDPADWWISQAGPLYNTLQHCSSGCGFTLGAPNEHLFTETPAYDHAVVIDYNTRNAPGGVHAAAGSAFFLHVSQGAPTAGCVSVPMGDLVRLMRWLNPHDHPRIMIGE